MRHGRSVPTLRSKMYIKRRGLCLPCYDVPTIREKYPSAFPRKARLFPGRDDSGDRPITEAELDAMVEEQMKCLPTWWWDDFRKLNPVMWEEIHNNESENNDH